MQALEPLEYIEVPPSELHMAADEFLAAGDAMRTLVERLDKTAHGLETRWAGAPQQVFYREYLQLREVMGGMTSLLVLVGEELQAIAQRFLNADS